MEETTVAQMPWYINVIPFAFVILCIVLVVFFAYVAITIMKRMKERNTYLREIRDELRQQK